MKLSFEELKALAETVSTKDTLEQISGGRANDCHDEFDLPEMPRDNTGSGSWGG